MKYWHNAVLKVASNWVLLVSLWVVVASGVYSFFIVPKGISVFNLSGQLDSGWAAIIGGTLGGCFGVLGIYLTLRSNRIEEMDKRLFEARKVSYSKAVAMYMFARIQRKQTAKKIMPSDAAKAIGEDLYKLMADFQLFSSKELISNIQTLFSMFDIVPPVKNTNEWREENDRIIKLWGVILNQMRLELGTDPF